MFEKSGVTLDSARVTSNLVTGGAASHAGEKTDQVSPLLNIKFKETEQNTLDSFSAWPSSFKKPHQAILDLELEEPEPHPHLCICALLHCSV